ncbi:MAG: rubredoxin [Desulfobulbus sp.]|nr:rubredoxin [Desulfobulbus sp.]
MAAAGERYICVNCGYTYDPAVGDPMNGVPPGVPFTELPEEWVCPMCYVSAGEFDAMD